MLWTCSIRDLPAPGVAARWAIVRYAMARQRVLRESGVEWRPELAPSRRLHRAWSDALSLSALGDTEWLWRTMYLPTWHAERTHDDLYRRLIGEAAEVAATRGLYLACWCADEAHCHRSLVAADVRALLGQPRLALDPGGGER